MTNKNAIDYSMLRAMREQLRDARIGANDRVTIVLTPEERQVLVDHIGTYLIVTGAGL